MAGALGLGLARRAGARAVRTRVGLRLRPDRTFGDYGENRRQAQLIWTPGGDVSALNQLMPGGPYLDFPVAQGRNADDVCSVCEGALRLAAAGLPDGYAATTRWAFIPCFAAYPRIRVAEGFPRHVIDRNRITGRRYFVGARRGARGRRGARRRPIAKSVQMTTQYFPDPPFQQTITPATTCPVG
ncbi:MAG TPA: hypothetical protein VLF18_09560 [Tahibacter sp.]|uniref:hypothetical protein n=1 Tax=Tahibacter sp. TaxID=2056211 RepID=UPI002C6EDB07|nr:hypothetical protein [Tahibacter sp.]HSX60431.1 hypothetical protein [Tahibacter sp.]